MHTINLWDKLHLSGQKVILLLFVGFFLSATTAFSQDAVKGVRINRPLDDQKLLNYGFTLGLHTSALRLKFSDSFIKKQTSPQPGEPDSKDPVQFDTVANITSPNGVAFSIGFLGSLRVAQYLDIRLMPKVSFYDYAVNYQYFPQTSPDRRFVADFTAVDIPLMFKYKSVRRKNFRMFYVGGVTPTIDVTGKKQREENEKEGLRISGDNLSMEIGFGTDFYFQYFKFSPEIRYSHGLVNVLSNTQNDIGQGFTRMSTQGIALYLVFN